MFVLAQARTGGHALAAGRVARRRGLLRVRCQIGQLQPGRALPDPAHRFEAHPPVEGTESSRQPPSLSSSRTSERWRHHDRHGEVGAGREGPGRRRAPKTDRRTADNPRAAPSCDAVRRAKKGRLDEGRHPRARCLPKFRRTPRKRRPGRKTGVRKTAASGQPPHESKDYSKSGPPPFSCTGKGTSLRRAPQTLPWLPSMIVSGDGGGTGGDVGDSGDGGARRPRRSRRTRRPRRPMPWRWLAAATVVVLLAVAWVGVRGLLARRHLERARAGVEQLRADILAGQNVDPLQLPTIQDDTRRAKALTDDVIWQAVARTPYVGRTLRTSSGLATAVDDLTQHVLPDVVGAADALAPTRLRTGGAAVNLAPLQAAQPRLAAAATRLTGIATEVKALPANGLLPPVHNAVNQLTGQLSALAGQLDDAALAARLLPPMLGATGPRHYLVLSLIHI